MRPAQFVLARDSFVPGPVVCPRACGRFPPNQWTGEGPNGEGPCADPARAVEALAALGVTLAIAGFPAAAVAAPERTIPTEHMVTSAARIRTNRHDIVRPPPRTFQLLRRIRTRPLRRGLDLSDDSGDRRRSRDSAIGTPVGTTSGQRTADLRQTLLPEGDYFTQYRRARCARS